MKSEGVTPQPVLLDALEEARLTREAIAGAVEPAPTQERTWGDAVWHGVKRAGYETVEFLDGAGESAVGFVEEPASQLLDTVQLVHWAIAGSNDFPQLHSALVQRIAALPANASWQDKSAVVLRATPFGLPLAVKDTVDACAEGEHCGRSAGHLAGMFVAGRGAGVKGVKGVMDETSLALREPAPSTVSIVLDDSLSGAASPRVALRANAGMPRVIESARQTLAEAWAKLGGVAEAERMELLIQLSQDQPHAIEVAVATLEAHGIANAFGVACAARIVRWAGLYEHALSGEGGVMQALIQKAEAAISRASHEAAEHGLLQELVAAGEQPGSASLVADIQARLAQLRRGGG